MIDDFNLFKDYLSIKKHLESKTYNVLRDDGVKIPRTQYENSKSFHFFGKLSNKFESRKDSCQYIVANLLYTDTLFHDYNIGLAYHMKFLGRQQQISYMFEEDLKVIRDNLCESTSMFDYTEEGLPLFFELYLQEKIHIETASILVNHFCQDREILEKCNQINKLWKKPLTKVVKCNSFIPKPLERLQNIYERIILC